MGKGGLSYLVLLAHIALLPYWMLHMQLLHAKGIANLLYVVHAYVLVTYAIDIFILCDIMWLC